MIGQLSGHASGHIITGGSGHVIGQTPGHTCTAGHSAGYGCTGHTQTGGNATRSAHAGPVHSAGSVGSNHDRNIGGGLGGGPHPHGSDIGREITNELIKEVFKELWKKEISKKDKGQKPTGEKLPPRRRRLWQKRDRNGYSYSVSAHFDHESLTSIASDSSELWFTECVLQPNLPDNLLVRKYKYRYTNKFTNTD